MTFKKGFIPWNKGTTGLVKSWNKGTKGLMPVPWNKGLTYKSVPCSEEKKQKISLAQIGKKRPQTTNEKNGEWKGGSANYVSIHTWVSRHKGKPETCEHCGKTGLVGCRIQWANIDHKYYRVLDDYIRLCVPCHRAYDKSRGVKTTR